MIPLLLPLLLPLSAESELLFVGVIWRHGDRAPGGLPYPLDAHNATAWPRGWNQLTNEGIKQMADLGTWLRNRYTVETEHINGVFNKDEVLIRSSDSERALTSAQALTTALFPPEAEFVWKKGLTWQPVPIHSNGEDRDDPLLKPTNIKCPAYDKLKEEESHSLLKSLNDSNHQLFQTLSKNTGMEITAANVDDLYDINREIIHGLKQPAWVTDDLVEQIKEFKRVVRTNEFNSQQKARFRGGYLLGDWNARINAISNGEKKAMKTVLYSSHDGTLSALLYTMGIANDLLVPYAAAIIAELHREEGKEFVKMWYRNDTASATAEPVPLALPGCDAACPLGMFNNITAPLMINSMEQLQQMCNSAGATSLLTLSLISILLNWMFS